MFWMAVSVVFLIAYLSILAFYLYGWYQSGKGQVTQKITRPVFVSIIIPARNEAENITRLLKGLANQDYPQNQFEVIMVDDASTDETVLLAEKGCLDFKHAMVIPLGKNDITRSHKKRAIEAGIEKARGELIVCTDADCYHPPTWLTAITTLYQVKGKKFIAAPVVYETKPTLLSVFQTLDFLTLQGITAASVAIRFHTMCNGANIAYSKQVFYEVGGFEGIDKLPTGDDMLLMHKVFQKYPNDIGYLRLPEAIVSTQAASTWATFFQQRIRWASKAAYYDDKRIFWVLLLVYFFNVWIFLLGVVGFWVAGLWVLAWVMLGFKTLGELIFLWPVAGFYHKRKWLWWFPLLQPIHILYTMAAGWLGRFSSYQWKGRVVEKPTAE